MKDYIHRGNEIPVLDKRQRWLETKMTWLLDQEVQCSWLTPVAYRCSSMMSCQQPLRGGNTRERENEKQHLQVVTVTIHLVEHNAFKFFRTRRTFNQRDHAPAIPTPQAVNVDDDEFWVTNLMGIKASKDRNLDNFIARTALWNSGELVIGLIKVPSLKKQM